MTLVHLPRLKEYRQRALLTQAELAAKSGVAEVTIARIETGHGARFSTIRKLAAALNVEAEQLMESAAGNKEAA